MAAPTDRVQVLKQESTAGGGDAADQSGFSSWDPINETEDALSSAGLFLQKQGGPADESVAVWREGDVAKIQDPSYASSNLLGELRHEALDRLTHRINESSYDEITRVSGLPSNITTWETSAKLKKIREVQLTRVSGRVTQIVEIQYDATGAEKERLTYDITRVSGQFASGARTKA